MCWLGQVRKKVWVQKNRRARQVKMELGFVRGCAFLEGSREKKMAMASVAFAVLGRRAAGVVGSLSALVPRRALHASAGLLAEGRGEDRGRGGGRGGDRRQGKEGGGGGDRKGGAAPELPARVARDFPDPKAPRRVSEVRRRRWMVVGWWGGGVPWRGDVGGGGRGRVRRALLGTTAAAPLRSPPPAGPVIPRRPAEPPRTWFLPLVNLWRLLWLLGGRFTR